MVDRYIAFFVNVKAFSSKIPLTHSPLELSSVADINLKKRLRESFYRSTRIENSGMARTRCFRNGTPADSFYGSVAMTIGKAFESNPGLQQADLSGKKMYST